MPHPQACAGYSDLTGVDYAEDAVRLARMVAEDRKVTVTFEVRCKGPMTGSLHILMSAPLPRAEFV